MRPAHLNDIGCLCIYERVIRTSSEWHPTPISSEWPCSVSELKLTISVESQIEVSLDRERRALFSFSSLAGVGRYRLPIHPVCHWLAISLASGGEWHFSSYRVLCITIIKHPPDRPNCRLLGLSSARRPKCRLLGLLSGRKLRCSNRRPVRYNNVSISLPTDRGAPLYASAVRPIRPGPIRLGPGRLNGWNELLEPGSPDTFRLHYAFHLVSCSPFFPLSTESGERYCVLSRAGSIQILSNFNLQMHGNRIWPPPSLLERPDRGPVWTWAGRDNTGRTDRRTPAGNESRSRRHRHRRRSRRRE